MNGVTGTVEAELTAFWLECKSNRKTIYKCGQKYEEEEENEVIPKALIFFQKHDSPFI